jgi:hypothetical protein
VARIQEVLRTRTRAEWLQAFAAAGVPAGPINTVADLAADERWPELAGPARAAGVRSVVAVPLDVPRAEVGAVSLYLQRPGGLGPDPLLAAMALVNQAEVLLGEVRRRDQMSTDAATVDRAVGVIIAQRGCGVREAYDVLGETAQRLGLDRRAVADRLVKAAARNAHPTAPPTAQKRTKG